MHTLSADARAGTAEARGGEHIGRMKVYSNRTEIVYANRNKDLSNK